MEKAGKITLSAPWAIYYRKLKALFRKDKDIGVFYDEESSTIKVYAAAGGKATALGELLPRSLDFGNVRLNIEVLLPNGDVPPGQEWKLEELFKDNAAISFIKKVEGLFSFTYVVFKPEVVQFFNDDTGDIHGLYSTLYADIAKELLEKLASRGIFFCTDATQEKTGMPLGEWP